jgi:hypothetical protein
LTEECGIIFSVDEDTWIGDSRNDLARRADVAILVDAASVAVWYELVLDSCPGQSHAGAVVRLE